MSDEINVAEQYYQSTKRTAFSGIFSALFLRHSLEIVRKERPKVDVAYTAKNRYHFFLRFSLRVSGKAYQNQLLNWYFHVSFSS